MKSIILHKQFVDDILDHGDAFFAKKMIGHIHAEVEGLANRSNDHRYHGVDDAWIRYASRGRTAYRIIYIVREGRIIFYRCGSHSVEDGVHEPHLDESNLVQLELVTEEVENMTKPLSILSSHQHPSIYTALLGRRLIPNKAVYLVSPFIDPAMLVRGSRIGQTLDSMKGDGADVFVITCADHVAEFDLLNKDLGARGIDLVFLPRLHSKIYLFVTDTTRSHRTASTPSLGIVGSSNLTARGIPATLDAGNLETNYTVAASSIRELENVAEEFYCRAMDYQKALITYNNRKASWR